MLHTFISPSIASETKCGFTHLADVINVVTGMYNKK